MRTLFIVLISSTFLLQSCTKQSVNLPLSKIKGIQDTIYNNSKIWLFFNENNGDTIVQLNKNNKITNTHYIFNIDKRLKLKHIKDYINKIQTKKEKPNIHSNGKYMHNYLSYVNTTNKKLSMIKFDSVKFRPINEINHHPTLRFTKNNETFLNDTLLQKGDFFKVMKSYGKTNPQKINLVFDKNSTYSQYVNDKAAIQLLQKDSIHFNVLEYLTN